jgi:hypothetical protein
MKSIRMQPRLVLGAKMAFTQKTRQNDGRRSSPISAR